MANSRPDIADIPIRAKIPPLKASRIEDKPKKPKPDNINKSKCPDIKLAPNRIPKLRPFAI
jgi:hypothetical protein